MFYINQNLSKLAAGEDAIWTSESLTYFRSVIEEALRSGGLHFTKGAELWDTYSDIELIHFEKLQSEGKLDETAIQAECITKLYQRQLSVPLKGMEETWDKYEKWIQKLDMKLEPHVKTSYEKARKNVEQMDQFEDSLTEAREEATKAAVYQRYLRFEIDQVKDPARIQALYERIVAELPLNEIFWSDYFKFVNRQFKSGEMTLSVLYRAVRNCSWSGSLWSDYIFQSEYYEKDHGFIKGIYIRVFRSRPNFSIKR